MLFNPQDIYTVYAGGSKTVLGNIMLLICSVDFANMVMIHKGKRKYPANSEKALMEILGVSERTWKDLRKVLFHKEHPILCKGMYGIGDKKFYRYYMNPLISIFLCEFLCLFLFVKLFIKTFPGLLLTVFAVPKILLWFEWVVFVE